ncbi:MAG: SpoIIE family protein phosphatase [Candidatus Riflebacteria bacterium]|nr:SpoIIE family protein phosphatase [Candidatus Riflebacteria bacterium]
MGIPLNLLLIEDSDDDAHLLLRELERGGFDVAHCRVETKDEMVDALTRQPWDLIISDYVMPRFSGLSALSVLHERNIDLPFLIVSGKIGEETAVEAMKAGAHDYLLKGNLFRLVPAIHRELADASGRRERRKTEEELRHAREQEVEIAARIQQTLLIGKPPGELEGARLAFLTIPSQAVDGDFYDFYQHRDMLFDLVIGDVMGKGIPAALIGAATKATFLHAMNRLLAIDPDCHPTPEEIITVVHTDLSGQLSNLMSFVTLIYARFDLETRTLYFVNCGHPPILHFRRATGDFSLISTGDPPLGVAENALYHQLVLPFDRGDTIFFYSDGVVDARNPRGEFFGTTRLEDLIRLHHNLLPWEIVNEVQQAVFDFAGREAFFDDLTCVAVQIHPEEIGVPLAWTEWPMIANLDDIPRLRSFIRNFAGKIPFYDRRDEWIATFELAVIEATTTVILHAYPNRPDGEIMIKAERFADRLTVRILHRGKSFDPRTITLVSDGRRRENSGLLRISQAVDICNYLRDREGRFCILLVKRFFPSSAVEVSGLAAADPGVSA